MRLQRVAIIVAICWTVLVGVFFLFGPVYVSVSGSYGLNPARELHRATKASATGFEVNGAGGFVPLAFPVVLAAAPLFARRSRRVIMLLTGTLLLAFCILAALSVGIFYLPAALLILFGAIPSRQAARAT